MSPIDQWQQTNLAKSLLSTEKSALEKFLPSLKGEIAVQYAHSESQQLLQASGIEHRFFVQAVEHPEIICNKTADGDSIQRLYIRKQDILPFYSSSVDLCILSHMLEYSDNPHQLLRESSDILVSGGHLVILGYNPYSFWGGRKLLSRDRLPWSGQLYSVNKIREWLSLLDFQITGGMMLYYSPLIENQSIRQRFSFMEQTGDRWWPMLGSVYLLQAQKREPGMTVIDFRQNFRKKSFLDVAEPAIRSYKK